MLRCGVHTLNNLFQSKLFTSHQFDQIAYSLSPDAMINPHKSMFNVGNYDINVMISAIQSANHQTVWFDRRKSFRSVNLSSVYGVIANVKQRVLLGLWPSRHWFPIRSFIDANGQRVWWVIDSKDNAPKVIGNDDQVIIFLDDVVNQSPDNQLVIILNQGVDEKQAYLPADSVPST